MPRALAKDRMKARDHEAANALRDIIQTSAQAADERNIHTTPAKLEGAPVLNEFATMIFPGVTGGVT
jgi:hypothetical protein